MIIYPPLIADTIPAFTTDKVIIPFTWNPAVSWTEVDTMVLQVKDQITSEVIGIITAIETDILEDYAVFNISGLNLIASKYYKFQIAYKDHETSEEYTFSSASIGRCIGETPTIIIKGLQQGKDNENLIEYCGEYQINVSNEAVYSYRFIVVEGASDSIRGTVLEDTGDIIYNNLSNTRPAFRLKHSLKDIDSCTIQFQITTVNGYVGKSSKYKIVAKEETDGNPTCTLSAGQSKKAKANGYVELALKANTTIPTNSTFVIERTGDGGYTWEELTRVYIVKETEDLSSFELKDCSVEQGQVYQYSIRSYTKDSEGNISYGAQNITETIMVDFEDIYLTDGERQLKVSFNPAVSSLKNTIMEQKTDTIGSQYPFFFRNGQIKYKEIPISGLISYLMDEDEMFMNLEDLGITKDTKSINLTGENIAAERKFKLEVLEWLTNGRPKLFRSPTEGNYVVRLMNVSMSPNTQLGRMLHTFSATGYEISDNDLTSLIQNKQVAFSHSYSTPSSALGYFILGASKLQ